MRLARSCPLTLSPVSLPAALFACACARGLPRDIYACDACGPRRVQDTWGHCVVQCAAPLTACPPPSHPRTDGCPRPTPHGHRLMAVEGSASRACYLSLEGRMPLGMGPAAATALVAAAPHMTDLDICHSVSDSLSGDAYAALIRASAGRLTALRGAYAAGFWGAAQLDALASCSRLKILAMYCSRFGADEGGVGRKRNRGAGVGGVRSFSHPFAPGPMGNRPFGTTHSTPAWPG